MKRIRAIFSILACVLVMCFGATAVFAEAVNLEDENLQVIMKNTAAALQQYSAESALQQYNDKEESMRDTGIAPCLKFWSENGETIGTLQDAFDFKSTRTGVTIECTVTLLYKNESGSETKVRMDGTIDNSDPESPMWEVLSMTTTEKDGVAVGEDSKGMGEKLADAGLNTLMGMGTVFIILILISGIIALLKFVPMLVNKVSGMWRKKAEDEIEDTEIPQPMAELPAGELADDLELVAVITAAIAASQGTSADGLVVRSIRRKSNKWKRA